MNVQGLVVEATPDTAYWHHKTMLFSQRNNNLKTEIKALKNSHISLKDTALSARHAEQRMRAQYRALKEQIVYLELADEAGQPQAAVR
jgi:hypothetical protein